MDGERVPRPAERTGGRRARELEGANWQTEGIRLDQDGSRNEMPNREVCFLNKSLVNAVNALEN